MELPDFGASAAAIIEKAVALEAATKAGLGLVAHRAEAAVKQELARKGHDRGTPTPSAPGEPPARVSGDLLRHIKVQSPTGAAGTYTAAVGPTMVYGRIQELGGVAGRGHHITLPARPYMAPALTASKMDIQAIMLGAWRRALGV